MRRSQLLLFLAILVLIISILTPQATLADDGPKHTPTPNIDPTSFPEGDKRQLYTSVEADVYESTAGVIYHRGFDPAFFSLTYYDSEDLFEVITPPEDYQQSIDFYLDCSGEVYPYEGCKLGSVLSDGRNYSALWSSNLLVPENGQYTFYLDNVDDGAQIWIDGARIVDQGWYWPAQDIDPSPQSISLSEGWHTIQVMYEQRIYYIASLQVAWSGPGFSKELIPVATTQAIIRVLAEDGETTLGWDELITDLLPVEAIIFDDNPPSSINAEIISAQSKVGQVFPLAYVEALPGGGHIYRGEIESSTITTRTGDMMIATIINDESAFDYNVAVEFMNRMFLPLDSRMGIARGDGDEELGYPPASVEFFQAGGYETASVDLVDYTVEPDVFFVQNQADILLYLGHGWHEDEEFALYNDTRVNINSLEDTWNKNLETIIFFGCSLLDINNMNGWNTTNYSPGIIMVENNPGPLTWLGFQQYAPLLDEQQGDKLLYWAGENYPGYLDWIETWKYASWELIPPRKYHGAVAIDMEACVYYYWKPFDINFRGVPRTIYTIWEDLPCDEWERDVLGLDLLVASPVELHIYDEFGNHVGLSDQGLYETEIPGSSTWIVPLDESGLHQGRRFSIHPADLSQEYDISIIGTGDGIFDLLAEIPDRQTGNLVRFGFTEIPVFLGEEFELHLGPGIESDLSLYRSDGQVVSTPELILSTLDLPINVVIDGESNGLGGYTSDVILSLEISPSAGNNIQQIEYDLGAGWQAYHESLQFSSNGFFSLSYRAVYTDGNHGNPLHISFWIEKINLPPVAEAGPDQTITEGSLGFLTGSGSFDPEGDLLEYSWEIVETSGPVIELINPLAISPFFFTVDDGSYRIQLTVTDSLGASGTDTMNLQVNNQDPIVEAGPDIMGIAGEEITFAGSISDPGVLDTHNIEWSFGEGSTATGTLTPTFIYGHGGTYTVVLSVVDNNGGEGSDQLTVIIPNTPPEIGDINKYTSVEGDNFIATMPFTDPDSNTWDVTIDYGDGSPLEEIINLLDLVIDLDHKYLDQGKFHLEVCVSDNDGNSSCALSEITVFNLPPEVDFPESAQSSEGNSLNLGPISFTDSGILDNHTASVDWGDGNPIEAVPVIEQGGSGTVTANHVYLESGDFIIQACLADLDGGETCGLIPTMINNLAPQVSLDLVQQVNEGELYSLSGASFYDPGLLDTHTATINWGDGSPLQALVVLEDNSLQGDHIFDDNGEYDLEVCVRDDEEDQTCAEFLVLARNVPPTVDAGIDQTVFVNTPVEFNGNVVDPGTADTHIINWNFGDGTSAEGTLNPTHIFTTAGTYLVELSITDDDGGEGSDQVTIKVEEPTENRIVLKSSDKDRCLWIDLESGAYYWYEEHGQEYSSNVTIISLKRLVLFRSEAADPNRLRGMILGDRFGNASLWVRDGKRWMVSRIIDRDLNDQDTCP